jgi:hypothetical protein
MPAYNRRQDQLARDFGKRRAAHDRTSQCRGHEYQQPLPLYEEDEYGEEEVTKRRKPRRSKEQIEKEKTEQEAEERRLRALFDDGDTTFTTLGVIDVNLQPKKQGRKKKEEKGEEREEEGKEKEKVWRAAGKENIQAPPSAALRKRGRDEEQLATTSTVTAAVNSALVSLSRSTVTMMMNHVMRR